MKIAVLIPEWKTKPHQKSDPSNVYGILLAKPMKESGAEITPVSVVMDGSAQDSSPCYTSSTLHTLYNFFSDMEEFDLIHNHLGLLPLFLNPRPTVPILTIFHNPLTEEEIQFVIKAHPLFYFISHVPLEMPESPNFMGTFPPEVMARHLPELTERILALTRREDRRPWGYYVILADEPDHKVKRIVVWPEKRLSLQRHRRRSEHWHVIQGKAIVTIDENQIPLEAGQSVDIPRGAAHRIQNPDLSQNLVFIEVQRGDYFGEDDIERLEDDYGRT